MMTQSRCWRKEPPSARPAVRLRSTLMLLQTYSEGGGGYMEVIGSQHAQGAAPPAPLSPVYVLLRLLYRFNGTLKFTEVRSFFPQPTVVFAFVSCKQSALNMAVFSHGSPSDFLLLKVRLTNSGEEEAFIVL